LDESGPWEIGNALWLGFGLYHVRLQFGDGDASRGGEQISAAVIIQKHARINSVHTRHWLIQHFPRSVRFSRGGDTNPSADGKIEIICPVSEHAIWSPH